MADTPTDARIALLTGLIDHAPTFPPARLPPVAAIAEDRRAQASPAGWLLDRLVWPGSELGELGDLQRELSVVVDGALPRDGRIAAAELRRPEDLAAAASLAAEVYVELPVDASLDDELAALGRHGLRAKVRCGGATAPTVAELARFVRACRAGGVVFKATAGLHHAVRRGDDHGFLNLLAAVVFADEEAALADEGPDAFELDAASFRWRDREAGPERLARARAGLFHSIGSCSFFEPVAQLASLGMLPVAEAGGAEVCA